MSGHVRFITVGITEFDVVATALAKQAYVFVDVPIHDPVNGDGRLLEQVHPPIIAAAEDRAADNVAKTSGDDSCDGNGDVSAYVGRLSRWTG